jgi:hypothetical protein
VTRWIARVGTETAEITSLGELREILGSTRDAAAQELWLAHAEGPCLCMLRSGGRALLMFLRGEEDTGLLGIPRGGPRAAGTVEFTLANGQRDEHPAAQTVSAEEGVAAIEHFFMTGELTPALDWTDSQTGE